MAHVVSKFMKIALIKGCNTLLTDDNKIPSDEADKTKDESVTALKFINNIDYNEMIIAQEDTVCFQIVEEAKKKI